ncbi:uncharacterized protein TNCV_2946501 [Trichonephila clavipes]|nr:uncharacterized protein TNCV_2946501 [Trichonephila clavipes]
MFKNCRKEDLRIVALELGETVAEKVIIVELTEIIKENKYFKENVGFVKELIQYTIEDRKRAEEDRKKEAGNRLREKEPELARLNVRVNSDNERTGEGCNSLDALVKSVRILTVKVPNRPEDAKGKEHCGFIQAANNLEHSIRKFWEIENVEIDSVKTSELDICEDRFKNTHSRDDQGRYTMAMPLKENPRTGPRSPLFHYGSLPKAQVCLYYKYRENVSHDKHTPGANVFAKNSVKERHRRTNKNVRELTTVNYGTVSAPYLATSSLKQLAMVEANNFPLAAPVVRSDCYMNDILSVSESIEEVIELQHQLIEMFKTTGMHLHKWCGNLPEITSNLQEIEQQSPTSFTKRMVLSTIARIFDPLGLLGPIITWAKIFTQRLWLLELGWSDELPFKEKSGVDLSTLWKP